MESMFSTYADGGDAGTAGGGGICPSCCAGDCQKGDVEYHHDLIVAYGIDKKTHQIRFFEISKMNKNVISKRHLSIQFAESVSSTMPVHTKQWWPGQAGRGQGFCTQEGPTEKHRGAPRASNT